MAHGSWVVGPLPVSLFFPIASSSIAWIGVRGFILCASIPLLTHLFFPFLVAGLGFSDNKYKIESTSQQAAIQVLYWHEIRGRVKCQTRGLILAKTKSWTTKSRKLGEEKRMMLTGRHWRQWRKKMKKEDEERAWRKKKKKEEEESWILNKELEIVKGKTNGD